MNVLWKIIHVYLNFWERYEFMIDHRSYTRHCPYSLCYIKHYVVFLLVQDQQKYLNLLLPSSYYHRVHLLSNIHAQNMFSRDVKRLSFKCQTFPTQMWGSLGRVGVLLVHNVLLTVHCQRGQEVGEKSAKLSSLRWRAKKVSRTFAEKCIKIY